MSEPSFSINRELHNRFVATLEYLKTAEQALYQQSVVEREESQQQQAVLERTAKVLNLQKECLEKVAEGGVTSEAMQIQYQEKLTGLYKDFGSQYDDYLQSRGLPGKEGKNEKERKNIKERETRAKDYEDTILGPEKERHLSFSFEGNLETKLALVIKQLKETLEKYHQFHDQRTQWIEERVEAPATTLREEQKDLTEHYELQAKQDIWRAAAEGDSAACLKLLKAHPNKLNALSEEGYTPLHLACLNGQLETVKLLLAQKKIEPLKKDTDRGLTALHYAMKSNKPNSVEVLKCFRSTNLQTILGKHQETLLHMAARSNNVLGAQWLFGQGFTQMEARLDEASCRRTALHFAALYGATDMVRCLIIQGANVKALNSFGGTPLSEALSARHEPTAAVFLEQGIWLSHQEQAELFKDKHSALIKDLMARLLDREKARLEGSLVFSTLQPSFLRHLSSDKVENIPNLLSQGEIKEIAEKVGVPLVIPKSEICFSDSQGHQTLPETPVKSGETVEHSAGSSSLSSSSSSSSGSNSKSSSSSLTSTIASTSLDPPSTKATPSSLGFKP